MTKRKLNAKRGRPEGTFRHEGPRQPNKQPSRIPREKQEEAKAAVLLARSKAANLPMPVLKGPEVDMTELNPDRRLKAYEKAMSAANFAHQAELAKWRKALDQPWMGDPAGLAVAGEKDVADLWDTMQAIRQRRRAWLSVIDSPDEFPAISSLKPPSDDTEGDAPPPHDFRTAEEKTHDAEAAWNAIANALFTLGPLALRYICGVVVRGEPINGHRLADVLRAPSLKKAIGR